MLTYEDWLATYTPPICSCDDCTADAYRDYQLNYTMRQRSDQLGVYMQSLNRATYATSTTTTVPTEVNAMPTAITYGIEMECSIPEFGYDPRELIASDLRALGINAIATGYSGRDYRKWQIKSDGSLNASRGHQGTCEVVSPVLTWDDEESARQVRVVSEYLLSIGAGVNQSCGMHTHVNVGHLTGDQLSRFILNYHNNQPQIDGLIARYRRASNGGTGYARPRDDVYMVQAASYARSGDFGAMARYLGGHCYNINGDWYSQRGTLEMRQRDATVNHYKIMGWVGFLVGLIRAAEADDSLTGDSTEDMLTSMVTSNYVSRTLADWALRRVPSINVVNRIAEARAAARTQVNRLLNLQGVRS